MSEPYLVAHLVRGQPAFDIAIRMCEGDAPCQPNCGLYPNCKDEEFWIIPTSGHRAYPYWQLPLDRILVEDDGTGGIFADLEVLVPVPPPSPWPDHYAPSAAPKGQGLISNLAERLGLIPKPPTITRR